MLSFCKKKNYLILAVLGLRCCIWAFSSWGTRAFHCDGFSCCGARLQSSQVLAVASHGLSSHSSWSRELRLRSRGTGIELLRGMWDLPGSGIKSMSPALAGGFFTTEPPGKPLYSSSNIPLSTFVWPHELYWT